MKPGTLPWKSWLAGYDSQKTPAGDSGTDTDVGTKPETQSDDAELDAAFDAAFGEKFGEDKKPSGSTKEVVPVEQPESPNAEQTNAENAVSATTPRTTDSVRAEQPNNRTTEQKARAAIESIDTSTRDGEFEAMTKVAEIANAHGVNPNELWRDVYFEPEGADRDIVSVEKPQPTRGILKRKPTPLETRDQIKKAYETGQIDAQQVLEAISKPAKDKPSSGSAKADIPQPPEGYEPLKEFTSSISSIKSPDLELRDNIEAVKKLQLQPGDAIGWRVNPPKKGKQFSPYWQYGTVERSGMTSHVLARKADGTTENVPGWSVHKLSKPADAVGTSQAGEPVDVTGGARPGSQLTSLGVPNSKALPPP